MSPAIVKVDGLKFMTSVDRAVNKLGGIAEVALAATTQAMVEYCEYLLALISEGAPRKTGRLVESGYVAPPRVEGDFVVVEILWNAPYAQIQDAGGIITPKDFRTIPVQTPRGTRLRGSTGQFVSKKRQNTARLFIPLREGVYPIADAARRKAAGFKINIDFVLSRYAVLHGNRFISNVMEGEVGVSGLPQEDGSGAQRVGGGGEAKNAARTVGLIAERIWAAMSEMKE